MLSESGHLGGRSLAIEVRAGFIAPVGLPVVAVDLLVALRGAFGRQPEREGLESHVGREFSFALGLTLEPDRTAAVFVAIVVAELRRRVSAPSSRSRALTATVGGAQWLNSAQKTRRVMKQIETPRVPAPLCGDLNPSLTIRKTKPNAGSRIHNPVSRSYLAFYTINNIRHSSHEHGRISFSDYYRNDRRKRDMGVR